MSRAEVKDVPRDPAAEVDSQRTDTRELIAIVAAHITR
jgi:hypothetical protein